MENCLDEIIVTYISSPSEEHKTTTYKEFIALNPEELSKDAQQLQKKMARLYNLNNRKPPLYHSFPKRKGKPLTIDATTIENSKKKEHASATFIQERNSIIFYQSAKKCNLLNILAHELKHAEQFSDDRILISKNGLALRQLEYAAEAQAYTFASYVWLIDCIENKRSFFKYQKNLEPFEDEGTITKKEYEKHIKENSVPDWKSFEEKYILNTLPELYYNSYYGYDYDERFLPIKETDKDISELPESFCFSKDFVNKELLDALEKIPHESLKKEARFLQLLLAKQEKKARMFLLQNFIKRKSIVQGGIDLLNNYSALKHIDQKDYRYLLKKLKENHANLDKQDDEGHTPLMLAVMEDNIDEIKALADAGADLNVQNGQMGDITALHVATVHGNKDVMKALIEADINLDTTDDMGFTALFYALTKGNIGIFKMLIDAGANLNLQEKKDGFTPLHMAVLACDKNAVKILLDAGADIDIKTNAGKKADELELAHKSLDDVAEIREILSEARRKKEQKNKLPLLQKSAINVKKNASIQKKPLQKQKINNISISLLKSKKFGRL